MDDEITYKVSVYDKLDTYRGKKRTTYYVRWRTNEREWKIPFHHSGANTANRKRTVLNNLMKYAVIERKLLTANPLTSITWTQPRKLKTVDPRGVINPDQARRFLNAFGDLDERGKRLKAFFGCMYYAAMRPEEITDLRDENLASMPDSGWGRMTPNDEATVIRALNEVKRANLSVACLLTTFAIARNPIRIPIRLSYCDQPLP